VGAPLSRSRRSGESNICYILINDFPTLVWAVSLANLEMHPFMHRVEREHRSLVVSDMAKELRKEKVFIDGARTPISKLPSRLTPCAPNRNNRTSRYRFAGKNCRMP